MNNILGVETLKPIKFKNSTIKRCECFHLISGASIKCFECNSNVDIRCALPYPPSEFAVNCDVVSATTNKTYNYCRKISQVIQIGINSCKLHFFFSFYSIE